jgi:hypothetical protein
MIQTSHSVLSFQTVVRVTADVTFLKRQLQVLNLLRHLNLPLTDPELIAFKDSFSPLNNQNKFKVTGT